MNDPVARSSTPKLREPPESEGSAPTGEEAPGTLLVEDRNVWRLVAARRAAFLVDAAAFFDAFAEAVARARESILIVGWDIDSRVRLRRDGVRRDLPNQLGPLLNAVVSRRRSLQAHVIDWDFSMLYALEREALPLLKLGWRTHRRLHFRLDGNHPAGASHHQKIVVVDDSVAFAGGLDLTARRWDTPEHRARDSRRIDPWGKPYRPFHDVQMMVEGEAAAALGELVRERWRRLTGESLRAPRRSDDCWPPGVNADLGEVRVGISRTDPIDGVREVEQLYLDSIAAARHHIYVETQYLTSSRIADALAESLAEAEGPEIVVVNTLENVGWLEEVTMGGLRARLLKKLRAADRHGRFRIYYPVVPGIGDDFLKMHAKVMVVDDRLVRIGSSNLNNRSMGLDTECDLAVESEGNPDVARTIAGFRDRLLGEHLGAPPDAVAVAVRDTGSLVSGIERLRGGERTLVPLDGEVEEWVDGVLPEATVVDPERPIEPGRLIEEILATDQMLAKDVRTSVHRPFLRGALVVLVAAGLVAGWRWGPLSEWLQPSAIAGWLAPLRESPAAPFLVLAGYVVAGFAVFPVTVLILATVLLFGAWKGFLYSLAGSIVSAAATYGVGRFLGRNVLRSLRGSRLGELTQRMTVGGILPMAAVRAVPIAPYTVVNLVAGATRVPFRVYLLGTVVGMLPGILGLTLFGVQLADVIRDPGPASLALLAAVGALLLGGGWWIGRALRESAEKEIEGGQSHGKRGS